ncbi:MAG TPA: ATP-binding protein [Myxococcaceae bacterium]|nr:ATP-binding protein [Myxococcaceae bacterium]
MPAATKLNVSLVRIHDVLGIADLEIAPGALTVIEGGNGKGKTSVLEAIRAVAQLRAREASLPLVCVDGLELLDAETFDVFRRKAPAAGLQLVVTRVGAGDLTVTPIPAEVA